MPSNLPRGAKRSPAHIVYASMASQVLAAIPDQFTMLPPKISTWGNTQYGCCVSSEEAFAKAAYSVRCGLPETFVSEGTLIAWAKKYGFLNGASLTEVMDVVIRSGIIALDGHTYNDGRYQSVDWTNDAVLSSAIYQGPVKIGVASDQLEHVMTPALTSGWVAVGFRNDTNLDHCVSLCGYGTTAQLCAALGVPVPNGATPGLRSYLLFTWGTIGIIDRASLLAITGEGWLRSPTTVGQVPGPTPVPPTPVPVPPTPTPVPPGVITVTNFSANVAVQLSDGRVYTGTVPVIPPTLYTPPTLHAPPDDVPPDYVPPDDSPSLADVPLDRQV